ncbi:hypothetical protein PoB_000168700 [Plakobranchus ocellatus]|uniref:Uncharacterized protein n=1 Tax=Plakobranchus ocellatus TaxID=259542 RepID=A0AAV3XXI8_9GAST|nr:hypothetical protein PoB_000168700 [Plakobranchus ocellatus]
MNLRQQLHWNHKTNRVLRKFTNKRFEVKALDVDTEVQRGLRVFGFTQFRPGQKDSIMRILRGVLKARWLANLPRDLREPSAARIESRHRRSSLTERLKA